MLDQASLRSYEAKCTQESPPPCRQACPFQLDCQTFLRHLAQGDLTKARQMLERQLPLAGITALICDHPCETACLRQDLGGALALHLLERFCLLNATLSAPSLPLPPKNLPLAIFGTGLAGLCAAWDLAKKKYPLTIFYQGELNSLLFQRYPSLKLHETLVEETLASLLKEKVTLEKTELNESLLKQVEEDFAAVFLDVDAAPSLAQKAQLDPETLCLSGKICAGGWPKTTPNGHEYFSASKQASEGRFAAQTMERLAKNLSLTAERKQKLGPLHPFLTEQSVQARVLAKQRDAFGQEYYDATEAKLEAARCLHCQCLNCVNHCSYLKRYQAYPKIYARQIHNNASIVKGLHTANKLINGCSLCGQCTELCPEHFSMADLCLLARQEMVAKGTMPPAAHEFALEDMAQASGPEAFLLLKDQDFPKPAWLFFPGCQLAASRGDQVEALYFWLKEKLQAYAKPGLALLLACCGQPAAWAGRQKLWAAHLEKLKQSWEELGRPTILTACSSCLTSFQAATLPCQSVWEVLADLDFRELLSQDLPDKLPALFAIQDPCTARKNTAWLTAVRKLVVKCGKKYVEPNLHGEQTACCGYGGDVWCAQPETARAMALDRAAQFTEPILASCIMCRDRLVREGQNCWHLLDLLFPKLAKSGSLEGPSLAQRRQNRARLKCSLLGQEGPSFREEIKISPELAQSLEERHILRTDVEETILAVEKAGIWSVNRQNGHRLGSLRPRKVTFWVEYSVLEDGYLVHDAYCHRMIVPGAGLEEADAVIRTQQNCAEQDGRIRA